MTDVDGVPHTWDANGNLLNDGVNTYAYDAANRMVSIQNQGSQIQNRYNGLGDRLQETMNGATTTFSMDLNTGLTQALSDGTNSYLYGVGRIAQGNTTSEYFLSDALGSVRQMANAAGEIALTKAYDPFGKLAQSFGSAETDFGFTGEITDASGLIYLRARYYSPGNGRFISKDSFSGYPSLSQSQNPYIYGLNNPIRYTDPTGNNVVSNCLGSTFSSGRLFTRNMSARELVNYCQTIYSESSWRVGPVGIDCSIFADDKTSVNPKTVWMLFQVYVCEAGNETIEFDGAHPLTRQLANSIFLDRIRRRYYSGLDQVYPREMKFDFAEYFTAFADIIAANKIRLGELPLTHFLGSFNYSVSRVGDRIGIKINNRSDLSSGTHFPGVFPPKGQEAEPLSLQELVGNDTSGNLGNTPALTLIKGYEDPVRGKIVSILQPLSRSQTGPGIGGGVFNQIFTWTERDLTCDINSIIWPKYLNSLDIRP